MKKKLILPLLFLFSALAAFSQNGVYPYPLPPDSSVWTIDNFAPPKPYGCGLYGGPYCSSLRIAMRGDTLIRGITYKKVYSTYNYTWNPNGGNGYNTGDSLYHIYDCAIRQDTLANKVYLCLPNKTSDTLLYTYNLHLGDTLPKSYIYKDSMTSGFLPIVRKIDTVLVGSVHYRRFQFNTNGNGALTSIMQGIGTNDGPFAMLYRFFEGGPVLACFNGHSLNGQPTYSECNASFTTGIKEKQNSHFSISPNPSGDGLFSVVNPGYGTAFTDIYDLLGKKIYSEKMSPGASIINLSSQRRGIYFYRILFDGKLIGSGKLVIE